MLQALLLPCLKLFVLSLALVDIFFLLYYVCFCGVDFSYFHLFLCVYTNTEDSCHGVDWRSVAAEL